MSGHTPFETLRTQMSPERRARNAAQTRVVVDGQQKGSRMSHVLELSDETYSQLADLAQHQQRTLEEMFRLCVAAYAARGNQPAAPPELPEEPMMPDSEYPVVLAYQRPPVQRLPGVVRTVREGPRTPALTDEEWQSLGLEDTADAQ